jgi:hypothetical protein
MTVDRLTAVSGYLNWPGSSYQVSIIVFLAFFFFFVVVVIGGGGGAGLHFFRQVGLAAGLEPMLHMIFQIFSPKKLGKMLAFFAPTTASFCSNLTIRLVFEKKFSPQIGKKLLKISIRTSTLRVNFFVKVFLGQCLYTFTQSYDFGMDRNRLDRFFKEESIFVFTMLQATRR